jgi:hypothetical protein
MAACCARAGRFWVRFWTSASALMCRPHQQLNSGISNELYWVVAATVRTNPELNSVEQAKHPLIGQIYGWVEKVRTYTLHHLCVLHLSRRV